MRKFNPIEDLEFWCHHCDRKKVSSRDRSTGHFYMQFGHIFRGGKFTEEYEPVVWAICSECEE